MILIALATTINKSATDILEIINKVDNFYNSSWNKLIVILSGFFLILTILVPIFIGWYQKRLFKIEEREIKLFVKEEIEKAKQSLIDDIESKVDIKTSQFREMFDNQILNTNSIINFVNANNLYTSKNYESALIGYIKSAKQGIEANSLKRVSFAVDFIISCIDNSNEEKIKEVKQSLVELIDILEKNNENDKYDLFIFKIRQALERKNICI
ncbi:hypothetical protein GM661_11875 [Iocasia frigidifontis]|uniref:Uncharacterized protein n=1 Tax=Iocasia fonsfrigidae TaxID=2682810 RepID=A0A8A7KAY4_9FIRM|nr:hypothetical protein [Iocasia fonsfrigidae]QTL98611.1 hypothetical protein GM661_11875 [Iocasia fonsfrigidae]